MAVSYELTDQDQIDVHSYFVSCEEGSPRWAVRWHNLWPRLLFWIGWFILQDARHRPVALAVVQVAGGIAIGSSPWWLNALWIRQVRAFFRRPEMQRYREPRIARVEATGLRMIGPTGERLLLWDGLTHSQTETLDIFHLTPLDAIVIPRRAFTSDAHRQSFLDAVEAAKSGAILPSPSHAQAQTWWTQSGVTEAQAQNNQRH